MMLTYRENVKVFGIQLWNKQGKFYREDSREMEGKRNCFKQKVFAFPPIFLFREYPCWVGVNKTYQYRQHRNTSRIGASSPLLNSLLLWKNQTHFTSWVYRAVLPSTTRIHTCGTQEVRYYQFKAHLQEDGTGTDWFTQQDNLTIVLRNQSRCAWAPEVPSVLLSNECSSTRLCSSPMNSSEHNVE